MTAPTHSTFGILSVSFLASLANIVLSPLALSFAALGAMLPDIDTTASAIGRICFPISLIIERKFGHRTITHSLLGVVIFSIVFIPLLFLRNKQFFLCLVLGYLSHLILDAVNKTGVPLFYPNLIRAVIPANERLRVITGSREEFVILAILVGFTLFIVPMNRIGIKGALHYLIRTSQSAVTDYLNFSAQGHEVLVEFEGIFNVSQKRIKGLWQALGSKSRISLIIKDPKGRIYSIGSNPDDNIRSLRIKSHKHKKITVSSKEVHLQEQLLSDIFDFIPEEDQTYLLGYIKTYDKLTTRFKLDEFATLKAGVNRLDFLYATKEEIISQDLTNVLATEGQILIRTIHTKKASIPTAQTPIQPKEPTARTQVITFYIKEVYNFEEELKVRVSDVVQKNTLLASLNHKRKSLLLEKEQAEQRLNIAEQELEKLKLKQKEELRLKQKESKLLHKERDLTLLKQLYNLELSKAKSRVDLAKSSLEKIEEKIKETLVYSPVDGKILSINIQHTTVTLRIITKEKFTDTDKKLPKPERKEKEKKEDERPTPEGPKTYFF